MSEGTADLISRDVDFADALHVGACREAETFCAFDRHLIRHGNAVGITVNDSGEIGA